MLSSSRMTVLVLCVVGCGETIDTGVAMSIAPESRVEHVVFILNPPQLMYGLSVLRCGSDRAVWVIGQDASTTAPPTRIVYGETPNGFSVRTPAEPLRPGCYRVLVSGPRSLQFTVNDDGTVSAQTGAPSDSGAR
jgi:hypothetical protein